jgi:serine/threonine-protein kinase
MKRLVLYWAVAAVAVTSTSVAVLGLLGTGITGTSARVLSQDEVRAALSTATPRAAGAPVVPPARTGQEKLVRSAGGTVIASCDGDEVTLRSWSPAQGYSVDGVEPGPADEASVEFEPNDGEDVELTITCAGGLPVTQIS